MLSDHLLFPWSRSSSCFAGSLAWGHWGGYTVGTHGCRHLVRSQVRQTMMWVDPMVTELESPTELQMFKLRFRGSSREAVREHYRSDRGELTMRGPFKYVLGPWTALVNIGSTGLISLLVTQAHLVIPYLAAGFLKFLWTNSLAAHFLFSTEELVVLASAWTIKVRQSGSAHRRALVFPERWMRQTPRCPAHWTRPNNPTQKTQTQSGHSSHRAGGSWTISLPRPWKLA